MFSAIPTKVYSILLQSVRVKLYLRTMWFNTVISANANGPVAASAVRLVALAGPLFSGLLVSFPDCIGTHVLLNIYTCVYDVQLLAIWCIPLVLLLSLVLHVGLLRTLPTSPCLSCFRNNRLERRMLCTGLFSQDG